MAHGRSCFINVPTVNDPARILRRTLTNDCFGLTPGARRYPAILCEPFQQARQAAIDAIDVEYRDLYVGIAPRTLLRRKRRRSFHW